MKNPCEGCLVVAICVEPNCEPLNAYIRYIAKVHEKMSASHLIDLWYDSYEIRPRCQRK